MNDAIKPSHYQHPSGLTCDDITQHMSFNLGNAFKYIWRYENKDNPIQDLEKSIQYIDMERTHRAMWPWDPSERNHFIFDHVTHLYTKWAADTPSYNIKKAAWTIIRLDLDYGSDIWPDSRNAVRYINQAIKELKETA